jgi:hypothetical protein
LANREVDLEAAAEAKRTGAVVLIHEAAHPAQLNANAERPWMELNCCQGATRNEKVLGAGRDPPRGRLVACHR